MTGEPSHVAVDLHRLVHRALAEPAAPAPEQTHLPVRIESAVTDPASPDDVPSRDGVTVGRSIGRNDVLDLRTERRRDDLVGIERQDPGAARRLEPVILLRRIAGPRTHDDVIRELARDAGRLVLGFGVDHDELVGPGDGLEARADALLLVLRDDHHREARRLHGPRSSRTAASTTGTSIDVMRPSGAETVR